MRASLVAQRNPSEVSAPSPEPQSQAPSAAPRLLVLAGLLLAVSGVVILMGIITAEALYPAVYTTHGNEISDLGATRPPDSIIRQPSARIFNATMLASGALIVAAAYGLHRGVGQRRVTIAMLVIGIAIFGVGVFPGNRAPMHGIFALLTFTSGGIGAILSAKVQSGPSRYLSILLGAITLAVLAFAMLGSNTQAFEEMGDGGVERWVAYPVTMWLVVFGAYLMGRHQPQDAATAAAIPL